LKMLIEILPGCLHYNRPHPVDESKGQVSQENCKVPKIVILSEAKNLRGTS
jgi:hypothetical protein